MKHIKMLENNI